jgi:hypothetical protein
MTAPAYHVRRATVDDLASLKSLWKAMRLPVPELERQLTDFQVAVDASGNVVGAFGFSIRERQGLVHGEAFGDFGVADEVRPLFWKRIQGLATNHGVVRLWSRENTPFWSQSGFVAPTTTDIEKLPAPWRDGLTPPFTLQLKDEDVINSLDKEIAIMMESERRKTAEALERAKTFKTLFTILAFVIALLVTGAAIYLYFQKNRLPLPPQ